MAEKRTHRRPFLLGMLGGGAALGGLGAAARVWLNPGDSPPAAGGRPALQLSADAASDVASLEVPLGESLLPRLTASRWGSARLPTSVHSMVGFTWRRTAKPPRIHIRSRLGGAWGPWQHIPLLTDAPDEGSAESNDVAGTDLVWIGASTGIQIKVEDARPADLTLVLLHPRRRFRDAASGRAPRTTMRGVAAPSERSGQIVPRPQILSRKDWGADESWRSGKPRYGSTIQQVHVHHTVSSNTYSEADVPGLIRGMYRYHTHNLGWSDIAYNFLVDRFGRTWTGRAGGAARPVRGAHTLGFNSDSTGVSVIGNYELVNPSAATLEAVAFVAAWKLERYGRSPTGTADVVSEGSDKFKAGRRVTLPVIDGHRDTNDTACPGRKLYPELPTIRARAQAIIDYYQARPVTIVEPPVLRGEPELGEKLRVRPGVYDPPDAVATYTWLRGASAIPEATESSYRCTADDVGSQLAVRVDLTAPGRTPASVTLTAPGVVTAPVSLEVRPVRRRGKLVVHIEATAPDGVSQPVTGQVMVRLKERKKLVELRDGKATARLGGSVPLRPGRYRVRVTYRGSTVFARAQSVSTVTLT